MKVLWITNMILPKVAKELKAKPDFFSEFLMLEKLLQHIPHQEGLHIEEIL